jgi:hypothetical protein
MALYTGVPVPVHLATTFISASTANIPLELGVVDAIITANATWTLPPINQSIGSLVAGAELVIHNNTAFIITLLAAGSDQIDGASSVTIAGASSCTLFNDNVSWKLISNTQTQPAPINGTFTVGTDFPTIQATFNYLQGKVIGNVLVVIPAPTSGITTYTETVLINGITSAPSQGYALTRAKYPLQNPNNLNPNNTGLSLRGDDRYIDLNLPRAIVLNGYNPTTYQQYVIFLYHVVVLPIHSDVAFNADGQSVLLFWQRNPDLWTISLINGTGLGYTLAKNVSFATGLAALPVEYKKQITLY